MKLTRSVSYAVGLLLRIDGLADAGPVTAAEIARGCRFPPRFLYRILRRLVSAGLLRGTSGPGGGYALARPARRITLLDVVEGVQATPVPSVLTPPCKGQQAAMGRINKMCADNARRFTADLRRVKLSQLARAKPKRKQSRRK